MMADRFFLDRDYAYTHPSSLKPDTVGAINFWETVLILVFLVIPCLGAVLMAGYLVESITADRAYLAEGREVVVTVAGCQRVSGTRSSNTQVSYTYTVDGQTFEGEHFIGHIGARCEQYPAGTTFAGLYLLSNHGESRIVDESVSNAAWYIMLTYFMFGFAGLSAGFVSLVMLFALFSGVFGSFRYLRLKSNGIQLDGELVDVKEEKTGKYKTDHSINVTYRFQTPDGRTLTRKQSKVRNDLRSAKPPPIGSLVTVLYADDNAVVML